MKVVMLLFVLALPPCAQAASSSTYAGQESRQIKALSASEQADLLAGKGMGFAKAAELNGYPGPAHVIQLASQLALSDEQLTKTKLLFVSMEHQAKELGRRIVDAEQSLDALFASKQVTPAQLEEAVDEIGALQANVRAIHLQAHLAQARILSAEQNASYFRLRGYSHGGERRESHEHGHH